MPTFELYSEDQYICDINHVLTAIKSASEKALRFVLFGHSQGAWVAFKFCSMINQPFTKLIIGDSGPEFPVEYICKVAKFYSKEVFSQIDIDKLRRFYKRSVSPNCSNEFLTSLIDNAMIYDESKNIYKPCFDSVNISKALLMHQQNATGLYIDFQEEWSKINIPIFLIHCEKSEVLTNEQVTKLRADKHLSYYIVRDFCHLPFEFHEDLSQNILQFILNN